MIYKDLESIKEARDLLKKTYNAWEKFRNFSSQSIQKILENIKDKALENAEYLAKLAHEETGFGIIEDKIKKNQFAAQNVYEDIVKQKTIGIIKKDEVNKIIEIAVPMGVIAAIIPSTNPTSTTIYKALIAIAGRNGIVFSPHPSAKRSIFETARILEEAAIEAGAPEGIISCMANPTIEGTTELMKNELTALILATGGEGLVRAAYGSGKPAYGVGPGNVPVYLDKSCDIKSAVKSVIIGKTFDNGTICASEQSIVVHKEIHEKVVEEFKNENCYFLNEEEKSKLEKIILQNGKINPKIVGKSASSIAEMAGLNVPKNSKILIAFEEKVGKEIPFSREKLSPLLAFYVVSNWEEGCQRCMDLLKNGGMGHTLVIHSRDDEIVMKFSLEKPAFRILVNTPASLGAIGLTTSLTPSLTLGCGTYGNNITTDNITAKHLINIKRVAFDCSNFCEFKSITEEKTPEIDKEKIRSIVKEILEDILKK